MNKSILAEMKKNSGLYLSESEISQSKQLHAESRLIGAFGRLLDELKWIKEDVNRQPGGGMGFGGCGPIRPNTADIEVKEVDKEVLYKIAMEKLAIVEKEMKRTFKVEAAKEKAEDDAEENEEE